MPGADAHLALVHPVAFAKRAIIERNSRLRPGYAAAEETRVLVFRGLPHVDYDEALNRRCLAQARQWRADGAEVDLRDPNYRHKLGADGRPTFDINSSCPGALQRRSRRVVE